MTGSTPDFIHRYVPSPSGDSTTLLLLHGTGGNEQSMLALGRELAPGAALLSPRGKVLEGDYPRFFRRKAEGVFDVEDLIARTHELADWLEAAIVAYRIPRQSLIALGYSNGANMAASMLLLHPGAFQRAVLFRAMLPLEPEKAPALTGTRVLIQAGQYDSMIALPRAESLAKLLRECGAEVVFNLQRADHGLVEADINAAHEWINHLNDTDH